MAEETKKLPEKTKKQPKDIGEQLEELKLRQLRFDRIELESQKTKKELIMTEADIRKLKSPPEERPTKPLNYGIIASQLVELSKLDEKDKQKALYLLSFWSDTHLMKEEEIIPVTMAVIKLYPMPSSIDSAKLQLEIDKLVLDALNLGTEVGMKKGETKALEEFTRMLLRKPDPSGPTNTAPKDNPAPPSTNVDDKSHPQPS